jgi:seryl-tRNA synthetase
MLQLQTLRSQKDFVIERLSVKHVSDLTLVDAILAIDEERRKIQTEHEDYLSKINAASKEIGKLMAGGQKEEAEKLKTDVANYKEASKLLGEKLADLEKEQQEKLVLLPNLPHVSVPLGKTPEENEVVRTGLEIPQLPEDAMPHWDLAKSTTSSTLNWVLKLQELDFPFI